MPGPGRWVGEGEGNGYFVIHTHTHTHTHIYLLCSYYKPGTKVSLLIAKIKIIMAKI